MGIVFVFLIGLVVLLASTLGFAAYWLTGGTVDPEIWRNLAVMWAASLPFMALTFFLMWMEAQS